MDDCQQPFRRCTWTYLYPPELPAHTPQSATSYLPTCRTAERCHQIERLHRCMRNAKICTENTFLLTALISTLRKEKNGFQPFTITQNICTKSFLRIHSVQHSYRNASRRRSKTKKPIFRRQLGRIVSDIEMFLFNLLNL